MAKDYKDPPTSRADSRLAHPMLLGIILGVLIGILISLSVALWLNRLSNPFMEKHRPVEPLPRVQAVPPSLAPEAARTPDKAPAVAENQEPAAGAGRFQFYQILPGDKGTGKDAGTSAKPPVVASAAPTAPPPRPGSSPAAPKPHTGDSYWLQVGAYADQKEADNQKARIALTGLEAKVRPVDVAGRGTLYRVRLGPYQSLDDANRMKTVLAQNGVAANIIHTNEDAQTP